MIREAQIYHWNGNIQGGEPSVSPGERKGINATAAAAKSAAAARGHENALMDLLAKTPFLLRFLAPSMIREAQIYHWNGNIQGGEPSVSPGERKGINATAAAAKSAAAARGHENALMDLLAKTPFLLRFLAPSMIREAQIYHWNGNIQGGEPSVSPGERKGINATAAAAKSAAAARGHENALMDLLAKTPFLLRFLAPSMIREAQIYHWNGNIQGGEPSVSPGERKGINATAAAAKSAAAARGHENALMDLLAKTPFMLRFLAPSMIREAQIYHWNGNIQGGEPSVSPRERKGINATAAAAKSAAAARGHENALMDLLAKTPFLLRFLAPSMIREAQIYHWNGNIQGREPSVSPRERKGINATAAAAKSAAAARGHENALMDLLAKTPFLLRFLAPSMIREAQIYHWNGNIQGGEPSVSPGERKGINATAAAAKSAAAARGHENALMDLLAKTPFLLRFLAPSMIREAQIYHWNGNIQGGEPSVSPGERKGINATAAAAKSAAAARGHENALMDLLAKTPFLLRFLAPSMIREAQIYHWNGNIQGGEPSVSPGERKGINATAAAAKSAAAARGHENALMDLLAKTPFLLRFLAPSMIREAQIYHWNGNIQGGEPSVSPRERKGINATAAAAKSAAAARGLENALMDLLAKTPFLLRFLAPSMIREAYICHWNGNIQGGEPSVSPGERKGSNATAAAVKSAAAARGL